MQKRIGKGEKSFFIFKLKSMKKIEGYDSTITTQNDPRVTKFGHFLRKTKLDELPQVLNVLFGSMSLVGPRPTVASDFERMSPKQRKRFTVKSGITGLAQVNGNTSMLWPERIDLDVEYIENWTFFSDIKIILKTVSLILTNNAETHPISDDEWEIDN
jgi:lipopolysaccharide/colanic/teichoic acid biosynthesis glycosyltransferase